MANRNMKADMNVQFTEASSRQSIESGESVKTLFGKIRKWLSDLKPVAFSGSYNDLSNKPTTGVSGAKGNSETSYRTGNVNLTPANIGAVDKSGDTITGNLVYKVSDVDASLVNNNLSATKYLTSFSCEDKINRILSRNEGMINSNGKIGWYAYVRNYNTSGTIVAQKGLKMEMNKSGTLTWTVDDAANFRTAINAASKGQVNYNTNNGVKNLLKADINPKTQGGLTFTPQPDGTILVNGTSTISSQSIIFWNLEVSSATSVNTQYSANRIGYGNFIVSLNAGEGTDSAFALQCLAYADNTVSNPPVTFQTYFGNSINVTIPTDKKYVWFRILVGAGSNGVTYNNFVLKPMIRDASIEDSTFEPYAKSNAELTRDKLDKTGGSTDSFSLNATAEGLAEKSSFSLTTMNAALSVWHNITISNKTGQITLSCGDFDITLDSSGIRMFDNDRDNGFFLNKSSSTGPVIMVGSYEYEFKEDGIYYNGNKIVSTT